MARMVRVRATERFGIEAAPPRLVLVCPAEFAHRRMNQLLERDAGNMRIAGRIHIEQKDPETPATAAVFH